MTTTAPIQQQVQSALARFEQLANSLDPPTRVLGDALGTMVRSTGALGGAIWMQSPAATGVVLRGVVETGDLHLAVGVENAPTEALKPILAAVFQSCKPTILPPDSPAFQGTDLAPHLQFFVPVEALGRAFAVAQVVFPGGLEPQTHRSYLAFLQQGARAAGSYLARRHAQIQTSDATAKTNLLNTINDLLAHEDEAGLLHELAARAETWLAAARVAVVSNWGKRMLTTYCESNSTVESPGRIQAVEKLAGVAIQRNATLTFARDTPLGDEDALFEPLLKRLYVAGETESLCITPVRDSAGVVAVLVAEYKNADQASGMVERQQEFSSRAASVVRRYIRFEDRPLKRADSAVIWMREHPKLCWVIAMLVSTLIVGVAWWIHETRVAGR